MAATIAGVQIPKGATVDIRIAVTAPVNVTAFSARQKVNRFVITEISTQLLGEEPDLHVGERLCWSVPVVLTSPAQGVVGKVGDILVDVTTGEMLVDEETVREDDRGCPASRVQCPIISKNSPIPAWPLACAWCWRISGNSAVKTRCAGSWARVRMGRGHEISCKWPASASMRNLDRPVSTQLTASLGGGVPPIVFLETSHLDYWKIRCDHVAVVVGLDAAHIFLNDPYFDTAPQRTALAGFLHSWAVNEQFTASSALVRDRARRSRGRLAGMPRERAEAGSSKEGAIISAGYRLPFTSVPAASAARTPPGTSPASARPLRRAAPAAGCSCPSPSSPASRAHTACRTTADCAAFQPSAGQKRELSGVSTSSIRISSPSGVQPHSNFVSARITPRAAAWSAARLYRSMLRSRSSAAASAPTILAASAKEMFSSWPFSSLVAGVKIGSGSRPLCASPPAAHAADRAGLPIFLPTATGQLAAYHALDRHHLRLAHQAGPARQLGARGKAGGMSARSVLRGVGRRQRIEPEQASAPSARGPCRESASAAPSRRR